MRWGKDNEKTVRRMYVENRAAESETMTVTCSGLHLMVDKSNLGASPDGLVLCYSVDNLCNDCLKIKCPYSIGGCVTVEFFQRPCIVFFLMRSRVDGSLY